MYTYIVVDDESLTRKGTIKKLETLNDQVICIGEAQNGTEALTLIAEKNPDIIITDMNMPIMDGLQFLKILTAKHPEKCIIIISGYKDFEYMKQAITAQAIDYIIKPFSRETIRKAILHAVKQLNSTTMLENQMRSSLVEEHEQTRFEFDVKALKNAIMGYDVGEISLVSKRLKNIDHLHNFVLITICSSAKINEEELQQFLDENNFGDLSLFISHLHQDNSGSLILFIPKHSVLPVSELCKQVSRSLYQLYFDHNDNVLFGISLEHPSFSALHDAYLETVAALNNRLLTDHSTYFFLYKEVKEARVISWDKSNELLFRIEAGMPSQVNELTDEFFSYLAFLPNCSVHDVKMYCISLVNQIQYVLNSYFSQTEPLLSGNSMKKVLNFTFRIEDLRQYYLQFFSNIAFMLQEQNDYSIDDTVEKMKIYVRKHYQNDITVEFLSSLFYLSRSYCSHLFRQRTGDTFVNYLNKVRIEKACRLLIETDKKTYQIAKAVGYDNDKYFFRIFKKYEHITPEQYRIKMRNAPIL